MDKKEEDQTDNNKDLQNLGEDYIDKAVFKTNNTIFLDEILNEDDNKSEIEANKKGMLKK